MSNNTSSTSPWTSLSPSSEPGTSQAIRVDTEHPYDFFWALSAWGAPQLICRLPGTFQFPEARDVPPLKLISVHFQHLENNYYCIVELQDRAHEDNFRVLCTALVEAARKATQPDAVLPIFLRHLTRWQRLLGRSIPAGIMSTREQIGLFGELFFLYSHILQKFSCDDGVCSWVAPQEHPQDFHMSNGIAVEIKSKQATAPDIVHIASQHQLHQPDCPLFLVVFSLTRAECEQKESFTLHSLVQVLRNHLMVREPASEEFEVRLLQRGYVDTPEEYDQHWWRVSGTRCFSVSGNFPRLEPPMLPVGIVDIQYAVALAECLPYSRNVDDIFVSEALVNE